MNSTPKTLIHVVGPPNWQNTLLTSFLEGETGAKCVCTPELNQNHIIDKPRCLILWDCRGNDPDNLWAWLEARQNNSSPLPLIALFNVFPELELESDIVHRGARGAFCQFEPLESFFKGIQAILDGELWFPRETMAKFLLQGQKWPLKSAVHDLTTREQEILAQIASGSGNQMIADELCISPHTVKTHTYNIFKKIDVTGRFQAALWAAKHL